MRFRDYDWSRPGMMVFSQDFRHSDVSGLSKTWLGIRSPPWLLRLLIYSQLIGTGLAQPPQAVEIVGVTNSADFQPGLPQRGSLASIFVKGLVGAPGVVTNVGYPLSNMLNGISVTIDSSPAPILAIAFENGYQQINVQVPWDLRSDPEVPCDVQCGSADVEVAQNGIRAGSQTEYTGSKLFYVSILFADANGYGIFQHAIDYSLVTPQNPAHPGEYLIAYGINLGPVTNTPPTGAPALSDPLSISIPVSPVCGMTDTIGGTVLFVGLAPGMVGVYQINFQLSASVAAGDVPIGFGRQFDLNPYGCPGMGSEHETLTQLSRTVLLPVR